MQARFVYVKFERDSLVKISRLTELASRNYITLSRSSLTLVVDLIRGELLFGRIIAFRSARASFDEYYKRTNSEIDERYFLYEEDTAY